ncbi:proton channel OTOP2-like, partial [Protopterus annectens]|uniref:proton channel OTOP2-like n=1 Tax=Protopterus annectens TaxID=7888 RepID=UPI001CFB4EE0
HNEELTLLCFGITAGGSNSKCECTTDICKTFQNAYFYLYPFNIEYSLFASCMSYVMWKNVGRVIHVHGHHAKLKFNMHGIVGGPILGLVVAITGLAIFIVYEVEVSTEDLKKNALMMYYVFNIISLILMSMGSLGGSIIYRFDKRCVDSHKNPSRTLDVALLLGAALGQYTISYYSIVAIAGTEHKDVIAILNLFYALLVIIQHSLQNVFLIEGLQKEPYEEENSHGRNIQIPQESQGDTVNIIYTNNDAFSSFVNENITDPGSAKRHDEASNCMVNGHDIIPPDIQIATATAISLQPSQLSLKRRLLKEISVFLLLCNVIFWIMPAFGARPQFDHKLEMDFYKTIWVTIVNIGLPFGIFYRMHSVASLFEIYITS